MHRYFFCIHKVDLLKQALIVFAKCVEYAKARLIMQDMNVIQPTEMTGAPTSDTHVQDSP